MARPIRCGVLVRSLPARYPDQVSAVALLGAVREPAEAGRKAQRDRAAVLREKGTAATGPGPVDPKQPLLLVTGSDDKVGPPAASQELVDAHGNAVFEIVPGVGHWTALEAAGPVIEQLRKFL
ncbi:MAG TPA: alpha/beta hydrolase [Pseudonocardia sp.]|uniref:alpha/beta fold hydrolase n=1 Tax=Pseudonocardia sp. TaxID=60912 RepID=UPI002F424597